ncbi:diguanylate cyclase [Sulfuricurvum sp.]|uniref:diguanylate cyclase n=1 Tax=Sulfuricurvum sp. TaxID=2025608 RepID=UPI0026063800|nr:diguanylate cyclase [Sulfuricurvum sp.]MDD4950438.1 diguanylate cyclase [Sulfuricurvum sp.]
MSKASILIVDDEPINLQKADACLRFDYELHFARNGLDALKFLSNHLVDIILLDIIMPDMDGFTLAKELRKSPTISQIPIIYLTADNAEATIAKAFDNGAYDYIIKPFRPIELLARVNNRIETQLLKKRNDHLLTIIKNHIAYLKSDTNGIITEVSQSFYELFQCKEELIGLNVNILKSGYTPKDIYTQIWKTIKKGETFNYEIEDRNFDGGTNWYKVTITSDITQEGEIAGYIAFYHNIDEKIRFEHDSYTDFLTGLNNRSKFEEKINEEIKRSLRYNHPLSLIMIDIDHFKEVNDIYGHVCGDTILKEFSTLLSENIRQTDLLARWGGEEFVILCPHTDLEGAVNLAESLRGKIEEHTFCEVGLKTASFGVAQFQCDTDAILLFQRVDHALYQAKEQGRNKVIRNNEKCE